MNMQSNKLGAPARKNIAVIGSGIAGNVAAYKLSVQHNVTLFEKNDYVGGHTHTHTIEVAGQTHAVDTGFIVFNDRTYPHFNALLKDLGIGAQKTEMSFSVKADQSGIEYNGANLDTLFAQRRNLVNPRFHKLLFEILRFNKRAKEYLSQDAAVTLREFLDQEKFSEYFSQHYLIPMGAAIWSTDPIKMLDFPAQFFIRFFNNHGLLDLKNRPQWFVVPGGSSQYVKPLIESFENSIRLCADVVSLRRTDNAVYLSTQSEAEQRFDAVFIATHSDQALGMLSDSTQVEREVLGAIKYQCNEAVLHTDRAVLPQRRKAWAAWNYHLQATSLQASEADPVALTYNMNILQGINAAEQVLVTLNNSAAIDEQKIIKRLRYEHPNFTPESVSAQNRHSEINGVKNCYYCGAYWGNGFHEDGVASALKAVEDFELQQLKSSPSDTVCDEYGQ